MSNEQKECTCEKCNEKKQLKLSEVKMLYKYRHFDCNNYHIKTILNNEFYFASKDELNDPFDLSLRPRYEVGTKEQMINHYNKEINNYNDLTNDEKNQHRQTVREFVENKPELAKQKLIDGFNFQIKIFRLCSFSADNWNDVLMWAHYSSSNTGFCIGIDWKKFSEYLKKNSKDLQITPWVVEYDPHYPFFNPFMENESEVAYKKIFSQKYEKWSYENEVRLITNNTENKIITIPEEFIAEIYLGLKVSIENKQLVINALKLKQHKPKLYQIKQLDNSFEFDREEILY